LKAKSGNHPVSQQPHQLYWESTYAITVALMTQYPERNPEDVGLEELAQLVETLPGFDDDPAMVTERILLDIQTVWYEEATNL
jgi:FeS assembly protein IscX